MKKVSDMEHSHCTLMLEKWCDVKLIYNFKFQQRKMTLLSPSCLQFKYLIVYNLYQNSSKHTNYFRNLCFN